MEPKLRPELEDRPELEVAVEEEDGEEEKKEDEEEKEEGFCTEICCWLRETNVWSPRRTMLLVGLSAAGGKVCGCLVVMVVVAEVAGLVTAEFTRVLASVAAEPNEKEPEEPGAGCTEL